MMNTPSRDNVQGAVYSVLADIRREAESLVKLPSYLEQVAPATGAERVVKAQAAAVRIAEGRLSGADFASLYNAEIDSRARLVGVEPSPELAVIRWESYGFTLSPEPTAEVAGDREYADAVAIIFAKEARRARLAKLPKISTLAELALEKLDPLRWYIECIVPEGLTLLGAKAKTGKSFFALQAAVAIAGGWPFMGRLKTQKTDVLYMSLEMGKRGIKSRMELMGLAALPGVHVVYEWPEGPDGLQVLGDYLAENQSVGVVIIDVLTCFLGAGSDSASGMYRSEYKEYAPIRKLAENRRVAIVGVTHARKGADDEDEDFTANLYGGGGAQGVPNSLITIRRGPRAPVGALTAKLRDAPWYEAAIRFDGDTGSWSITDEDPAEALQSGERKAILEALRKGPYEGMRTKDIATASHLSISSASHRLKALKEEGLVESPKYGLWRAHQSGQSGHSIPMPSPAPSLNFDQIDHFDGTTERESQESPERTAPEPVADFSPVDHKLGEHVGRPT
jgi:DNA-binding transcriptional ArsR family regulator